MPHAARQAWLASAGDRRNRHGISRALWCGDSYLLNLSVEIISELVWRDIRTNNRTVVVEFGLDDVETLLRWSTSSLASVRCAVRANIVLMAATGFADRMIARDLDVGAPRVRCWVARYVKLGLPGLEKDAPRGGHPRQVSGQRVIELTTQTQPEAATQWSTRTMAKHVGASLATVSRIWRAHGLKPLLSETFKVSSDIRFEEKLTDIVGCT